MNVLFSLNKCQEYDFVILNHSNAKIRNVTFKFATRFFQFEVTMFYFNFGGF